MLQPLAEALDESERIALVRRITDALTRFGVGLSQNPLFVVHPALECITGIYSCLAAAACARALGSSHTHVCSTLPRKYFLVPWCCLSAAIFPLYVALLLAHSHVATVSLAVTH